MATEHGKRHRRWWERVLCGVLTAAVGLAGLGASCVEPVGPGGDAGDRADTSAVADAAAGNCRTVGGAEACRRRTGCQWLTATCDGGRIVGGCFAGSGWNDASIDCSPDRDVATAGDADAGTDACDGIASENTCQERSGCRWWRAYCGSRKVEARCIDRGDSPESPECTVGDVASPSDAGTVDATDAGGADRDTAVASDVSTDAADLDAGVHCRMHSDESGCRADTRCKWWVDACDGYVIEQTCVSKTESPTPTTCKQIPRNECHEVGNEGACHPPNCQWVAAGCGSGPVGTVEVTACLPEGRCQSDSDCPTDHNCVHLWTDVCHGSACQACGGETTRCVPKSLLNP